MIPNGFNWNVQSSMKPSWGICGQLKLRNPKLDSTFFEKKKFNCNVNDAETCSLQIIISDARMYARKRPMPWQKLLQWKLAANFERVINFAIAILRTPIGKHYPVLSTDIKIIINEIAFDIWILKLECNTEYGRRYVCDVSVQSFWPEFSIQATSTGCSLSDKLAKYLHFFSFFFVVFCAIAFWAPPTEISLFATPPPSGPTLYIIFTHSIIPFFARILFSLYLLMGHGEIASFAARNALKI